MPSVRTPVLLRCRVYSRVKCANVRMFLRAGRLVANATKQGIGSWSSANDGVLGGHGFECSLPGVDDEFPSGVSTKLWFRNANRHLFLGNLHAGCMPTVSISSGCWLTATCLRASPRVSGIPSTTILLLHTGCV